MNSISDIFAGLEEEDLEKYRRIIEWCGRRSGITDGICGVVGLDDLTADQDSETVFQGAPQDEELKYIMAVGAMMYTIIFSKNMSEEDVYPPIAKAMNAMAATFFQQDGEGKVLPWFDIFGDYTGRP
ncbi:MAG: hypothetical protein HDR26_06920 [Lachnospiraceae bacterium]|nr:hypothetical protein [Lachnospiraceae bacterium]